VHPSVQLRHVRAPDIQNPFGAERRENVHPQRSFVFLPGATLPLRLNVKRKPLFCDLTKRANRSALAALLDGVRAFLDKAKNDFRLPAGFLWSQPTVLANPRPPRAAILAILGDVALAAIPEGRDAEPAHGLTMAAIP
jgi:hypothetical protein